jgi:hypothetical protein
MPIIFLKSFNQTGIKNLFSQMLIKFFITDQLFKTNLNLKEN